MPASMKSSFARVTILCRLFLMLSLLGLLPVRAADPFISEFVPDNAGVATDEDGQYADLIEIQNPNAAPFDLAGYYLTDNPLQLTKWAFPPVTLPGNGFLVVFASGKNRINDTNRLHTNFQLNKDGGYLALVKPDGSNIANAFANYPAVKEDVAFGIAQKLIVTQPLAATVPQILVPTSAPGLPADWNLLSYAPDASWTNGLAPPAIGFDTNQTGGLPVNVAPSGTAIQSTLYQGTQYPATLAINGLFTDFTHTASTDNNAFWQITLTNEMAIHEVVIFNRGGGCCQWRLRDITVTIVTTNLSGLVTNWISPLLNPENVLNGPAYLTNNLVTLTGGPVLGRTIVIHRRPDPDNSGLGTGTAQDDQNALSMGEVVITASLGSGLQPYFTTDIKNLMYEKNPSAFVRMPFVSTNTPDTLTLNVRYDDGFVAYLNGTEVARRNAPGGLAFDSTATADRALTNATVQESIDLSANIPLLLHGTNLLAVQMLNHSAANGDALFQPQLLASSTIKTTNVFLDQVTMGALNDVNWYLDYVKDTHFSIDRGYFTNAFSLSITSGTPDALVYVSFNGDEPGPGKGFLYTNAFTITNTTVVRTRAFKTNWKPSDVDSASYLFVADIIEQAKNWVNTASTPPQYFPATWGANTVDYGMDPQVVTNYTLAQWYEAFYQIGTMSIVTEMANLFDANTGIYANAVGQGDIWERPISLELIDPTNAVQGRFQENAGLRIRGGASRASSFRKHSFRVYFRKDYGAGKLRYPLFEDEGADEFDVFALRTSQNYSWPRNDNSTQDTMVREVFSRKTLGDMGQPYRRSRYYHLFLNGQYWGLYETDEHPAAGYGETYFGGEKDNYDVVKNHDRYTSPPPAFSTEATDGNLIAFSNLWVMCRAHAASPTPSNYFAILGCNPDGTRNPSLPVMLDVDNLIDYMLSIFYTGDGDATLSAFLANNRPNNWYGMRDRTNPNVGFRFFNNDCEHTLGSPNSQVDRTGPFRDVAGSNIGNFTYANPQYFHEDLMWNPEYRQKFADHVQKHFFNGGALTLEACTNRFIAKAQQITKAIRAYSARWGDPVTDTIPRAPYGEADWTNTLNTILTTWFPPRAGIVLQQLRVDLLFPSNSAPNFSHYGGVVPAGYSLVLSQTNGGGVLYYTLDGSDPRAIGGGVNGSALAYSGAIIINSPTQVRARVLIGGVWSALIEAVYYPPQDLTRLVLTEIMYNPPGLGLISGDEFEYLELKNTGTNTLNLTGLAFTQGIGFTFPNGTLLGPGQHFLLVRNSLTFDFKYPGVPFDGLYTGQLDNSGETLRLSHTALGTTVFTCTYDDQPPWPLTPDNLGFSLVLKDPDARPDLNVGTNWRASGQAGGSPGTNDAPSALPPVLINEVLTASVLPAVDAIELFNPTANDADVGGWFLTDDPEVPKKFRIPDGTIISAGAFRVVTEADFNATPGTNGNFSLSSNGEQIYLLSGDGGTNLTGYSHGLDFGASAPGVTFGRYLISTGDEHFPPQSQTTLGTNNALPAVGPVVINEIHYHPDVSGDAFVEIRNVTANPVPLYDPVHPTNTWKLSGVGFTFPTNLTLGSNEVLVIVSTNPAGFRAKYSLSESVQIIGPAPGVLQDSGERLQLQRPGLPTSNGVPFITVDEVRYNDKAPWPPAADGSGPSLLRLVPGAYGNDPTNWIAASPSPGTAPSAAAAPVFTGQPVAATALLGGTASFTVVVSGDEVRVQWLFNGQAIPGATNTTLNLTNLQFTDAGQYRALAFNPAGSAASSNALLTVLTPVYFSVQPANQNVEPGTNVTITSLAVGNGPISYQWRFNGTNIPNATNASYSFVNANLNDHHGNFSVVATDSVSSTVSSNAFIYVLVRPGIVQHLFPQSVLQGSTFTLSIVATGAPPLWYRWIRGGSAYATTSVPVLVITNFQATTTFRVGVTNKAVPAGVFSPNAGSVNYTMIPDGDGDGLGDAWEIAYFGSTNANNGVLDSDGDGMSNGDEFRSGTNPTNALSVLKVLFTATNANVLSFVAQTNVSYSVQWRPDLATAPWVSLTNLFPSNQVRTITIDSSTVTPGAERYFRVVTPLAP
jgi:hypothetical protein